MSSVRATFVLAFALVASAGCTLAPGEELAQGAPPADDQIVTTPEAGGDPERSEAPADDASVGDENATQNETRGRDGQAGRDGKDGANCGSNTTYIGATDPDPCDE